MAPGWETHFKTAGTPATRRSALKLYTVAAYAAGTPECF